MKTTVRSMGLRFLTTAIFALSALLGRAQETSLKFVVDTRSAISIEDVTSDYCSGEYGGYGGSRATFLTGVRCDIEFVIETGGENRLDIDYYLVNGHREDSDTFVFNVGSLEVGGRLVVVAVDKDGNASKPFRVNFDVASIPGIWGSGNQSYTPIQADQDPHYGRVIYQTGKFKALSFFNAFESAADIVGKDFRLSFMPSLDLYQTVDSSTGQYRESEDAGITSRGQTTEASQNKKTVLSLGPLDVSAGISGGTVYDYSAVDGTWEQSSRELGVSFGGEVGWSQPMPPPFSWVFGSVSIYGNSQFTACEENGEWVAEYGLDPLVGIRAGVGVGWNGLAAAELWGNGGLNVDGRIPGTPNPLTYVGLHAEIGLRGQVGPFERTWTVWRGNQTLWQNGAVNTVESASAKGIAPFVCSDTGFQPIRRDYSAYLSQKEGEKSVHVRNSTVEPRKGIDNPLVLLKDGYPTPQPSLATCGTDAVLAYVRDNAGRTALNRTEVVFRQEIDGVWRGDESIWDDGTADFMPKLASLDDGTVFAVWVNAGRTFADNATAEEVFSAMELAVGVRDAETGNWTCRNLTSDSALDWVPVLKTAGNGSAAIAWVHNSGGEYLGTVDTPSDLCVAYFRDGIWSEPIVAVPAAGTVLAHDMAWDGERTVLVWSSIPEENSASGGGSEVFASICVNGVWGEPIRLSATRAEAARPYCWFTGDILHTIWTQNGTLYASSGLLENSGAVVSGAEKVSVSADYRLVWNADGFPTLVWTSIPTANSGRLVGDLVSASYSTAMGIGETATLIATDALERNFSGKIDSEGTLRLAYESVDVSTNESGGLQYGKVDLAVYCRGGGIDVGISSNGCSFAGELEAGLTNSILVKLENSGTTGAQNVECRVWLGEGEGVRLLTSGTTDILPLSGVVLCVPWVPEEGMKELAFTIEVGGDGVLADENQSNNTLVWCPDAGRMVLSFRNAQAVKATDTMRLISARIHNSGVVPLPAGAEAKFWRGGIGSELLGTDEAGVVACGDAGEYGVGIAWDVSDVVFTSAWERIVIELPDARGAPNVSVWTDTPLDSDNDGLTDAEEAILGTDSTLTDSDGDGVPDGEEVHAYGSNPLEEAPILKANTFHWTNPGTECTIVLEAIGGLPPYTFSAQNLPTGMSLSQTGILSGTINGGGTYAATIVVTDGGGHSGSYVVGIHVPSFYFVTRELPVMLSDECRELTFKVTGGRPPYYFDDIVIANLRWQNIPISYSGEVILGDALFHEAGEYNFPVRVTDADGAVVTQEFSLVVEDNPNQKPVIESKTPARSTIRIDPGEIQTFSIVASDPEGGSLSYKWGLHDGTHYLQTIENGTNTFDFNTSGRANGIYYIEVSVSDDGGAATYCQWTIRIAPFVPLGPTEVETPVILEGVYTNVWVGVGGGVGPYTLEIEGEIPAGMWYDGSEGGRQEESWIALYGTPEEGTAGMYEFTVRVRDAEGEVVEREFTLEVAENPNRKPVLVFATPTNEYFRVEPGESIRLAVEVSDPEGEDLTYTWEVYKNGEWASELYRYRSTSATYELPTSAGDEDRYEFAVYASDGTWDAWMKTWTVRVAAHVPLAAVEVETPVILEGVYTNVWLGVGDGVGPYTLEIKGEIPYGMGYDGSEGGRQEWSWLTLDGAPEEGTAGRYEFTVRVTDADGEVVEREFALVVAENPDMNHRPVIGRVLPENRVVTIRAGESVEFKVEASDPDGDELESTWFLRDEDWNPLEGLESTENGFVRFAPQEGDEGMYWVECRVEDGEKADVETWRVYVVAKDGIVIDQELPHAMDGVPYRAQLTATGGTAPYTWAIEDEWMENWEITEDGELTGLEDLGITGNTTIQIWITVTDSSGETAEQLVGIPMEPNPDPNQRPQIDGQEPAEGEWDGVVRVGEERTFRVEGHDPEGAALEYFWKLDGEGIECSTNEWTWVPGRADIGEHDLRVYCTDGERKSDEWSWVFRVVTTNVLSVAGGLPAAVAGEPYEAILGVTGGTEPYAWTHDGYETRRTESSFEETGIARSWTGDDKSWRVAMPFAFPFYGQEYGEIWISDNGTLSLDGEYSRWKYDEEEFRGHALIAPLWADFNGGAQTIYTDETRAGEFTVRWQAHGYGSGEEAAFSATLHEDGRIRFSYGETGEKGVIGISRGNDIFFLLPEEVQNADMTGAADLVFEPKAFVPGLGLSVGGVVSGIPLQAGTYQVPVSVQDAEGAIWSGEIGLLVLSAGNSTTNTPVRVPHEWLERFGEGLAAHGGDYEAFAADTAANGRPVWACYVADLDPTDPESELRVGLAQDESGAWVPTIVSGRSAERRYTFEGTERMPEGDEAEGWDAPGAGNRFFRAKVWVPEGAEE